MKKIYLTLLCLGLASCSVKNNLAYRPITEQQPENSIQVRVSEFIDTRKKPQNIGCYRNLYGMPIVSIKTEENVSEWVSSALSQELKLAGFSFAEDSKYEIQGSIQELYCDVYFKFGGKVHLKVRVLEEGNEIFLKSYYANIKGHGLTGENPRTPVTSLEENLQSVYKEVIADLRSEVFHLDD
ncbi:MAG: YajG family lipoprotein [Candidatus Algichlamydia australiensis]|nr:YajG family lipoprotein [Chlamydiales bacterium]